MDEEMIGITVRQSFGRIKLLQTFGPAFRSQSVQGFEPFSKAKYVVRTQSL